MIKKFDSISKEAEKHVIDLVIARIEEIGDSAVGYIAAQDVIDSVLEVYGPEIYNMGIRDAKNLLQEKFSDLEVELDILKQEHQTL
ncbi:MAG: DUF2164 family protein [Oscillospiraceae bacterium]